MSGRLNWGGAGLGQVRIGFGNVGIFDKCKERTIWDVAGKVLFYGKAHIGMGSRIVVGRSGRLSLGDNFASTAKMSMICFQKITVGKDVLISWETLIMDTDFHYICVAGLKKPKEKPISIGNHVWIGCRSTILKGSFIGDDSVVAAGSIVAGKYKENNVLIKGYSACVAKDGIAWFDSYE